MDTEFPAAHSMDTSWFAVDRDGHIGHFSTGEAGARPFDALIEDNPDDVLEEIQQLTPRGEVIYHLPGFTLPGPLCHQREHLMPRDSSVDCALCFLTSLDPVKQQLARGTASQVQSSTGFAVILRKPSKALGKRLHESGICQGCFWFYEPEEGEYQRQPGEHGLFVYNHLCENWVSGPYGCHEIPATPLHVDQLPPHLRALVSEMRFHSLSFAQTPHIQPVEHDTTTSWESAYLSSDGLTIRENWAAIDNECAPDEYAEFYEDIQNAMSDWLKGITIEPPEGERS
jgi:hypothetical protein